MTTAETSGTQEVSNTALLIYGIVRADAEPKAEGIGKNPAPVQTIKHGKIAALVSEVPVDQPLERAEDLQAFSRVVDGLVADMPVIPIRFGAALADPAAVEEGLLEPNADRFEAALDELAGHAEYLVKGQYVEQTVLREILQENEHAAALRETLRDAPLDVGRDERIALGEMINSALEYKRQVDGSTIVEALRQLTEHLALRPPTHEEEVADIAVLLPLDKEEELVRVVNDIGAQWTNRVDMRVVGPLAAWDFVAAEAPEQ
ncbi:GvpL/GvpF family gas vesicle protein [Nocardia huaxiensis]|uniref:GvpL/GvpF family gas vesicle protein n=1 Tax=Nocardia huaxiensis TaxID=2755382 RepID=A0A7D6ZNE1_9NOCA|nr:GvpL/GvpF family gas vesicle protein [Nocardia huaxiensis]QLY33920.1 GvpL/GvpF family gas vesicle protein [Nocardia huaxiensis]UFS99143.1 GvpL/GvpF family gas vesicle protein [Nocardia huaxiensis]